MTGEQRDDEEKERKDAMPACQPRSNLHGSSVITLDNSLACLVSLSPCLCLSEPTPAIPASPDLCSRATTGRDHRLSVVRKIIPADAKLEPTLVSQFAVGIGMGWIDGCLEMALFSLSRCLRPAIDKTTGGGSNCVCTVRIKIQGPRPPSLTISMDVDILIVTRSAVVNVHVDPE